MMNIPRSRAGRALGAVRRFRLAHVVFVALVLVCLVMLRRTPTALQVPAPSPTGAVTPHTTRSTPRPTVPSTTTTSRRRTRRPAPPPTFTTADPSLEIEPTDAPAARIALLTSLVSIDPVTGDAIQPDALQHAAHRHSWATKWAYCQRHGYDCIVESHDRVPPGRGQWAELLAVELWLERYDWLLVMDPAAFVMAGDSRIESIVEEAGANVDLITTRDETTTARAVNSAVFLIRNSDDGRELLRRWLGTASLSERDCLLQRTARGETQDAAALDCLLNAMRTGDAGALRQHVAVLPQRRLAAFSSTLLHVEVAQERDQVAAQRRHSSGAVHNIHGHAGAHRMGAAGYSALGSRNRGRGGIVDLHSDPYYQKAAYQLGDFAVDVHKCRDMFDASELVDRCGEIYRDVLSLSQVVPTPAPPQHDHDGSSSLSSDSENEATSMASPHLIPDLNAPLRLWPQRAPATHPAHPDEDPRYRGGSGGAGSTATGSGDRDGDVAAPSYRRHHRRIAVVTGVFDGGDAESRAALPGSARWHALRTHQAYAARHGYAFVAESIASIAANIPLSALDLLDPRRTDAPPVAVWGQDGDEAAPSVTSAPPLTVDLAAVNTDGARPETIESATSRPTDSSSDAATTQHFDYWPQLQPGVASLAAAVRGRPAHTGLTPELEGQLSWLKAAALVKWLPHFDYVLWVDPDVVIMDFTVPIAGLWRSAPPQHPTAAFLFQIDQQLMDDVRRDGGEHPDASGGAAFTAATGTTPPLQFAAFVVRSCRFARRFLAEVAWPLRLLHGGRDAASMQRAAALFAPHRLSCKGNPLPSDVPLPLWEALHCALDEAKVPRAGRYRRRFALLDGPAAMAGQKGLGGGDDAWRDRADTVEAAPDTTQAVVSGVRGRMPHLDGRPLTRMVDAAPQGAGYVAGAHGGGGQQESKSFDGTFSLFFRHCTAQGDACRAATERAYLTSLGRNGIHHDAVVAATPFALPLLYVPSRR